MNTEILFKNFHKKSKQEIYDLMKKFIDDDFFNTFPELKNDISVIITGSIAHNMYDKESDIDLTLVFHNEKKYKLIKFLILDKFKNKNLEPKRKPIELHGQNITSLKKLQADLGSWENDWLLREISDAIVIYDPTSKFQKLKEKYNWYPKKIYVKKVNWLFAEASFLIFDRYQTGYKRKSLYYTEIIKFRVLQLFMLSLLLINKKYPLSDKHLINDVKEIYPDIIRHIENIIKMRNMKEIYNELINFRSEIEKLLINKNLIKEKKICYWIGLRPVHKVKIG